VCNAALGAVVLAAQPMGTGLVMARGLAATPQRRSLNLVDGNATADEARAWDYSRDPWAGWDDGF
jgi:hypothetical protein